MPHEPRAKRDAGIAMCPGWIRGELAKLCNDLDGQYDKVVVAAVCALSEDGYQILTREEAILLAPTEYGPMMLHGYRAITAVSLAKLLETAWASFHGSPASKLPDAQQHEQAFMMFDQVIRGWLMDAVTLAGSKLFEGKTPGPALSAGQQAMAMWRAVAGSPFKFNQQQSEAPNAEAAHEAGSGPDQGRGPGGEDHRAAEPGVQPD